MRERRPYCKKGTLVLTASRTQCYSPTTGAHSPHSAECDEGDKYTLRISQTGQVPKHPGRIRSRSHSCKAYTAHGRARKGVVSGDQVVLALWRKICACTWLNPCLNLDAFRARRAHRDSRARLSELSRLRWTRTARERYRSTP